MELQNRGQFFHGSKKKLNSLPYVLLFILLYSSASAETYVNTTITAGASGNTAAAISTADAAGNTVVQKTITVEAAGNTALPVIISGDSVIFDNDSTEIFGKGNVALRHADSVIFADLIYVNPETGDVSGEGNVLAVFNNARIYTDKIYYNTKTQEAFCENADVISPPWIIKGERLVKIGDKTELKNPVFTTCDMDKPHYRMEAAMINLYGSKKIEAWHMAVYIGMIPVLYFPYFAQSLEGGKDPFDFKFGHNDSSGWYVNFKYFFFFRLFETMTADGLIGFDYLEKKGPAYNTNMSYSLAPNSTGNIAGSYMKEKVTDYTRWWINFNHSHIFNDKIRAGIRAKSSSDSNLQADQVVDPAVDQVDMFKHELAGSFSGTFFNSHSIGIDVNDTEQLEPYVDMYTPREYFTYSRLLPQVTYSMMSSQIVPFVNYGHSAGLTRSYQYVTTMASTDVIYSDSASFAPSVTVNTPKMIFATLSGSANLKSSWSKAQETSAYGKGEFKNDISTSETLQLDIAPGGRVQGSIAHSFAKQLEYSAVSSNQVNMKIWGGFGTFSFDAAAGYDMLRKQSELMKSEITGGSDIDRFSLVALSGSFKHDVYYMSVKSAISLFSAQVKNTSINFSIADNSVKGLWSASASAGYSNNRIDGFGHPVTVTPQDDSLNFSTTLSFNFTPDIQASLHRSYDLMQKTLTDQKYSLTWFIHCWRADLSWSKRADDKEEIFFSVAVSAIPDFRVSKPTTAMPDAFNQLANPLGQ